MTTTNTASTAAATIRSLCVASDAATAAAAAIQGSTGATRDQQVAAVEAALGQVDRAAEALADAETWLVSAKAAMTARIPAPATIPAAPVVAPVITPKVTVPAAVAQAVAPVAKPVINTDPRMKGQGVLDTATGVFTPYDPNATSRDELVAHLVAHNVRSTGTDAELTARFNAHKVGKPVIAADPKVAIKPANTPAPAAKCPVPNANGGECKGKPTSTGKCPAHSKPTAAPAPAPQAVAPAAKPTKLSLPNGTYAKVAAQLGLSVETLVDTLLNCGVELTVIS